MTKAMKMDVIRFCIDKQLKDGKESKIEIDTILDNIFQK